MNWIYTVMNQIKDNLKMSSSQIYLTTPINTIKEIDMNWIDKKVKEFEVIEKQCYDSRYDDRLLCTTESHIASQKNWLRTALQEAQQQERERILEFIKKGAYLDVDDLEQFIRNKVVWNKP